MKNKQSGFTFVELVIVLWFLFAVTLLGGFLYVIGHFVAKFW